MKKPTTRKLILASSTLRLLAIEDVAYARGGIVVESNDTPASCSNCSSDPACVPPPP